MRRRNTKRPSYACRPHFVLAIAAIVATAWRNHCVARRGADHTALLNTRSPSRDPAFLARLFDLTLEGKSASVLCDIGGAGQITPAADRRGRIGTVIEVNDPAAVPGAIPEAAFHARARADLDLVTLFGVCMYLDEVTWPGISPRCAPSCGRMGGW